MTEQEKPEIDDQETAQPESKTTSDSSADNIESDQQGGADQVVDADDELIAAHAEIAKLKDAFLRAKAEQDNVRRRAEKDIANGRKFAVEGFAKEMLNVYDSLKLAVAVELTDDADDAVKSMHEGVGITLKQLSSAFAKYSLVEISPEIGDKLDPNLHQAMTMVESPDAESGSIINVIQAGFQLHDRLLRPAMVVVAK